MKITLEVSEENEMTAFPYWLILDPRHNMRTSVEDLASQITGPFFSRASAERHLEAKRHHFTARARVYCHSGTDSLEYANAIRAGLGPRGF